MANPQIVEEISFQGALNKVKAMLQQALPATYANLNESDPAIAILEIIAYVDTLLRARVNNAVLATFINTATGSDLDNLVAFLGLTRKVIQEQDNSTMPPTEAVYESDTELRERYKEAIQGLSVAGPASSYVHFARLADERVKDAGVISPAPTEVTVYITSYENSEGIPSQDLIHTVTSYLQNEEIRPLGDLVTVQAGFVITANVYLEVLIKDTVLDKQQVLDKVKENADAYFATLASLGGFYSKSKLIDSCFNGLENELLTSVVIFPATLEYYQFSVGQYLNITTIVSLAGSNLQKASSRENDPKRLDRVLESLKKEEAKND